MNSTSSPVTMALMNMLARSSLQARTGLRGLAVQYISASGGNLLGGRPGLSRCRSNSFRVFFICMEFSQSGWTLAVQVEKYSL